MFERVLVTGSSGFVGHHLQRVFPSFYPLEDGNGKIDLLEPERVLKAIRQISPDAVIHLAAQSFVQDAFKNPLYTFNVNFIGTLNLLEGLSKNGFRGKMLYVSSGDVYGIVPEEKLPVNELTLPHPRNPYAVSKVAAEALCYQWSQTGPFEIVIARPFNHIGRGQSRQFALSDFAYQIVAISRKKSLPTLYVGDIDVTRDFTDVRDVVIAYKKLLEQGLNGEVYNVCSGKEYSIRSLLVRLLEISKCEAEIVQDQNRFRPSEQRRMKGDFSKIHALTGWLPQIDIEESLRELLAGGMEDNG